LIIVKEGQDGWEAWRNRKVTKKSSSLRLQLQLPSVERKWKTSQVSQAAQ
jgi:hypothetical protein